MVIDSILCRLASNEEFGGLSMLFTTTDGTEIGWVCPFDAVGFKGFQMYWHQMVFLGFDEGVPF